MRDELAKVGSTGKISSVKGVLQVFGDSDFTISSNNAQGVASVHYEDIKMDIPVQSINGRTMLPIRYFMEAYSPYSRVEWKSLGDVRGNGTHYGLVSVMSNGLIPNFDGVDISKLGGRNTILSKRALEMFAKETTDYMKELDPRYQDMYKILSQLRTPAEIVELRKDPKSDLHQMVNMTPIHAWTPKGNEPFEHKPIKIDSPTPTETIKLSNGKSYDMIKYYQGLPLEMWYTFVRLNNYDRLNWDFTNFSKTNTTSFVDLMLTYVPDDVYNSKRLLSLEGAGTGFDGLVPVSDVSLVRRLSNYDISMTLPLITYLGQSKEVIDYVDMSITQFKEGGGMRTFDAMKGLFRETNYEK